jgi:Ser/Thr protein kinase RdoA (MazF antagonist)
MTGASLLSSQILPHYTSDEVLALQTISDGFSEESYIVTTTQGQIVIRKCAATTTIDSLRARHDLIQFLVDKRFPTPPLIRTRDDATWLEFGRQFYEVYPFVEGETFSLGARDQIAGVGRILGKYHALAQTYSSSLSSGIEEISVADFLDLTKRIVKPLDWLFKHRRIRYEERQFVQTAAREIKEQIPRFRHEKDIIKLIVHGAVEPGNVVFSGDVATLLDWSGSLRFVRVFDVASALLKFVGRRVDAVLPGQAGPMLSWPRVESFASAYREAIVLTGSEAELLPWMMLTIRFDDALWIHEKLDMNYHHELKMVAEMHEWLSKNGPALGELFC